MSFLVNELVFHWLGFVELESTVSLSVQFHGLQCSHRVLQPQSAPQSIFLQFYCTQNNRYPLAVTLCFSPAHSQPWETTNLLSISIYYPMTDISYKWNLAICGCEYFLAFWPDQVQYVVFCEWFLLLNLMFPSYSQGSVHQHLILFAFPSTIPLYEQLTWCLPVSKLMNIWIALPFSYYHNAVTSTRVQDSVGIHVFTSLRHLPRRTAGSCGKSIFNLFRKCQTVPQGAYYTPTSRA